MRLNKRKDKENNRKWNINTLTGNNSSKLTGTVGLFKTARKKEQVQLDCTCAVVPHSDYSGIKKAFFHLLFDKKMASVRILPQILVRFSPKLMNQRGKD